MTGFFTESKIFEVINIEDFAKLDIRIVQVLESSRIDGSDKLLRLVVDIGGEKRQILAGLGKSYNPEELIDKKLLAIVNLEFRKMMGEESQGMILATGDDIENITLIQPEKDVEPGSRIR